MASVQMSQGRTFDRYFRMGDERTIEKLHAVLEAEGDAPSLRTLFAWSAKYGWQDQIKEYEITVLDSAQAARLEEARKMDERHGTTARLLQRRGIESLSDLDPKGMTPAQAIRAIDVGMRLERELRDVRDSGRKLDITKRIRDMAIDEGLDPDQAVADARELLEHY